MSGPHHGESQIMNPRLRAQRRRHALLRAYPARVCRLVRKFGTRRTCQRLHVNGAIISEICAIHHRRIEERWSKSAAKQKATKIIRS